MERYLLYDAHKPGPGTVEHLLAPGSFFLEPSEFVDALGAEVVVANAAKLQRAKRNGAIRG